MDDERLEQNVRERIGALAKRRGSCPTADSLLDYHEGDLAEPERTRITQHIQLCPICEELVSRIASETPEVDDIIWNPIDRRLQARQPRDKTESSKRSRSVGRWIGIAAMIAIILSAGVWWDVFEFRAGREESRTRGQAITALEPEGTIEGLSQFRWNALPSASRFRIEVRQGDHSVVSAESQGLTFRPPETWKTLLIRGNAYQWQVSALDSRGTVIAQSPWTAFQIQP